MNIKPRLKGGRIAAIGAIAASALVVMAAGPASADIGLASPRNSESGRCLDTKIPGGGNGNKVQLWDCNGQYQQDWLFVPEGSAGGTHDYEIESLEYQGMCLDVQRRTPSDQYSYGIFSGESVRLWSCNQTVSQLWFVPSPGNALTEIALVGVGDDGTKKCLDADTGTIGGNGTTMQIWTCLGTANQEWLGL